MQAVFDGTMDSCRSQMEDLVKQRKRIDGEIESLQKVIDANLAEGEKYGLKESPRRLGNDPDL